MMPTRGYFTAAELQAIWVSSVDELYAQPFLDAGDGGGMEAYNQAFAQYERVSQAIDNTMQALFILPHSQQSAAPAGGDSKATVDVTFSRSLAHHIPMIFDRLLVEEVARDCGVDGGVDVPTGRRYQIDGMTVIDAGSSGPVLISATAEEYGWSWNNPAPDSITSVVQPGKGQQNNGATIYPAPGTDKVYAAAEYGTFVPGHVGQYLILNSSANAGRIRRIVGYEPPGDMPIVHGGAALLSQDVCMTIDPGGSCIVGEAVSDSFTGATGVLLWYDIVTGSAIVQRRTGFFAAGGNLLGETTVSSTPILDVSNVGMLIALYIAVPLGAWIPGESLTQAGSGATGTFVRMDSQWAIVSPISGTFVAGNAVTGVTSTVVLTPTNVGVEPSLAAESATADWRILKWDEDLGVTVTNVYSPAGGRLGILDELGRERNIPRGNGESDDDYRKRIARLPDTVSPNAIRRACAKFFTPHGWTYDFREVGTPEFPGFFYDAPFYEAPSYAFAWDMDFDLRPEDRYKVWLDYVEFRAFFAIGVPSNGLGEYGFGYDSHPLGFYDIGPRSDYYDGSAYLSGGINAALWADLYERKAGGVGFDIYAL